MGLFLNRILSETGRYEAHIISPSTGSRDPLSVQVFKPTTWIRGPRQESETAQDQPFVRAGAWWSEFEFQRFRPRRALTKLLSDYDIVQVVAGGPSWALIARDAGRPIGLQVATLGAMERNELIRGSRGALALWRRLMTFVVGRFEQRGLAVADAIFVENYWMRDLLSTSLSQPDRVVFAPPGVDTERFTPRSGGLRSNGHLLCVGRFGDPRKRVRLLFRAYRRLLDIRGFAPPLVLAGATGPTDSDWLLADQLGIRSSVQFFERVPSDELLRLYREAMLFILSSDEEGLGIVILEAMASGLPVVATDCGGPSTSVVEGETGFIVPRGNAEELAQRTALLLNDSARAASMGNKGRERAVQYFSFTATARPFVDWYDRVLAAGQAP